MFISRLCAGLAAIMFLLNAEAVPEEFDLVGLRVEQSVISDVEKIGV